MWVAAETQRRPRPRVVFSRQGEGSERSGITLPDTRGWSTRVTDGSGVTLSLRVRNSLREASRGAKQCDLTAPQSPKHKVRHMHHKRACVCCSTNTTQVAHALAQPHVTSFTVLHVSQCNTTQTSTATMSVCVRSRSGF